MAVETASFISDLTTTNPPSTDLVSEGDDHIRLLKTVIKATLPNADRAFRFPEGAAKSGDYTILAADENKVITFDCSGAARAGTLPATAGIVDGWTVTVVKVDSSVNALTVTPASGNISGQSNLVLPFAYSGARITWDGALWHYEPFQWPDPMRVVNKSASATLTHSELRSLVVVAPASNAVITLPAASGRRGEWVYVKRNHSSSTVTLDGNSSETIDGAATYDVGANQACVLIVCDGSNWHVAGIIGGNPLGIASGGTGASTANTAFNALAPATTKGDIIARNSTVNTRLPVGANGKVLVADSAEATGLKYDWPIGTLLAIIEDRKSAGTNGGSASAGDNIRTLNTEVYDRDSVVSLASNRFTLIAGTYEIEWHAPAYRTQSHQSRLYNQTAGSVVARGTSMNAADGANDQSVSSGLATVTIGSPTSFEIRHFVGSERLSDGFGSAVSAASGGEVYTRVIIRKG